VGECLGSFASAFPIAFFEPDYNVNNKNSIMYGGNNISEQSLEGQDIMTKVAKNLPGLHEVIDEIGQFCESNGKYENAPHIIEVLLPAMCSYLTYWWQFSPGARVQQAANEAKAKSVLEKNQSVDSDKSASVKKPSGNSKQLAITAPPQQQQQQQQPQQTSTDSGPITNVSAELMNRTLFYILKLLSNNVDEKEAQWMNRIAGFSQSIIATSTPAMLERSFLPVSSKISDKTKELHFKGKYFTPPSIFTFDFPQIESGFPQFFPPNTTELPSKLIISDL
jgi:hypothetical protein